MFSALRPFLFNLDPETAHDLAIKSLKFNPLPGKVFEVEDEQILNIKLLGKNFPNPIGLAAGFDKSAEAYNSLLKLGFGFVEVGTVTPLKQYGNPKPRIFRLQEDRALINRLGFNNDGMEAIKARIKSNNKKGILGVNIGPNKETKDQKNDFCLGLKSFFDIADYITINISSPNTEGLRDFHYQEKLKDLIIALNKVKKDKETNIPLLLKISPDINNGHIPEISDIAIKNNISAIILTNTTNGNRNNLTSKFKALNLQLQWVGRTRSDGLKGVGYLSFLIRDKYKPDIKKQIIHGIFVTVYDNNMNTRECLGEWFTKNKPWNINIQNKLIQKVCFLGQTESRLTNGQYLNIPLSNYTITYLHKKRTNG